MTAEAENVVHDDEPVVRDDPHSPEHVLSDREDQEENSVKTEVLRGQEEEVGPSEELKWRN